MLTGDASVDIEQEMIQQYEGESENLYSFYIVFL